MIGGLASRSALCACLAIAAGCGPAARPRDPRWASPVRFGHLEDVHKVSDDLYRGSQPSREDTGALRRMGIRTVVNLRTHDTDRALLEGLDPAGHPQPRAKPRRGGPEKKLAARAAD